jgi:hypothetical protein
LQNLLETHCPRSVSDPKRWPEIEIVVIVAHRLSDRESAS